MLLLIRNTLLLVTVGQYLCNCLTALAFLCSLFVWWTFTKVTITVHTASKPDIQCFDTTKCINVLLLNSFHSSLQFSSGLEVFKLNYAFFSLSKQVNIKQEFLFCVYCFHTRCSQPFPSLHCLLAAQYRVTRRELIKIWCPHMYVFCC